MYRSDDYLMHLYAMLIFFSSNNRLQQGGIRDPRAALVTSASSTERMHQVRGVPLRLLDANKGQQQIVANNKTYSKDSFSALAHHLMHMLKSLNGRLCYSAHILLRGCGSLDDLVCSPSC